jgi:predicted DNA-binding transcriptional regulator YafY
VRDPTARALRLLSLLQSGATYTGAELATRLETSSRTVRRDADRLRHLGYRVLTRPGPGGSYQLAAGTSVPPLLFDEDEITVLIAGLRLVQTHLTDDDAADRALSKLEHVLPDRLARRVRATDLATEVLADDSSRVAAAVVGAVADAIAGQGRIRFTYRDQSGRTSHRLVDPFRHALRATHWYLVGFDLDRDDWRIFRFDRIADVERVAGTYRHREFPAASVARWFATDLGNKPGKAQ